MAKHLFILFFLFLLILYRSLAWAGQEIVAVQSSRVQPYENAIEGFKNVCDGRIERLIISELHDKDVVKEINKKKPDMVLAIGMDALLKVKRIKNIPIVYVMVLNPWTILSDEKNIFGISMNVSQNKQFVTLLSVIPEIKSVGLLYSKEKTDHIAKEANYAAGKYGVKLIAREVYSSKDVPQLMQDMKGKIEAFWMLPDLTIITPETVEFMLLFSLENKIPILAFSEKYVEIGALMSIGVDAFDMGSQAGEIANKILSGNGTIDNKQIDARKAIISINLNVAKKLGITVEEEVIEKARIIE